MSDIEVKRLGAGDADLLSEVASSFEGGSADTGHLADVLSDDSNIILAAFFRGEPSGLLLAHRLKRIKDASSKIFLYEIEVSGPYRRKGVGRALIERLLVLAKKEGSRSVFVFTNRGFSGAPEFYDATGATLVSGEELLFVYEL